VLLVQGCEGERDVAPFQKCVDVLPEFFVTNCLNFFLKNSVSLLTQFLLSKKKKVGLTSVLETRKKTRKSNTGKYTKPIQTIILS